MSWMPIQGFPGYSVSTEGEVRRDLTGRILRPAVNQFGVPFVGMQRDFDQKHRSLARLVAKAFLPQGYEAFDTPICLDGDRLNCSVDNLMWRPRWFAIQFNRQFREPSYRRVKGSVRCLDDKEVYLTILDAASRYGLLERDIWLSIEYNTVVWPTYQEFEMVE